MIKFDETKSLIVSYDGGCSDIPVLIVAQEHNNGKKYILNAIQGEEATYIFEKIIGKNSRGEKS